MIPLPRRLAAEFLAAALLLFLGIGSVLANTQQPGSLGLVGVGLAWGAVVAGLAYAFGPVSGAHFNPAVTIAHAVIGRFPRAEVLPYIGAQLAGAIAGTWATQKIWGPLNGIGTTTTTLAPLNAVALEFALSFAIMAVIMGSATDERATSGFTGLAVGGVVAADVMIGGALTGASMNPARSFAPALVTGVWTSHWLYWVGPVAGMVSAAWIYERLRATPPR
ncbi:MAG: aquaporin [Gemmatimonadaceae bacterium]|nr:aquaporin [Gemmatimonadaceae bacterium]